jgi:hypothetical protein
MAKDDNTFENLPNSAVEYINIVIKNMRYRKKARDEVREELVDHFEIYLKDCATNEEKEQKAQQLISEFGDPKILGILMRRAKKRCRPLWRTVAARTFQALAAMILLLVLYIAWFFTGKPVITTNYIAELNKIVRPTADDSMNAAPLYNKAIETLFDINDVKELLRTNFYDANDEQKNLIRKWLAKNEAPIALVEKASKLPYCWQLYESKNPEQSMMSVRLPPLYRQIANALCWRAWLNAQNNDFNSAFRNIETCYRLGKHHRGKKFLIEQLVGIAIEDLALKTTRQIIDTSKIESGTLADFQQRLQIHIDSDNFKPDFSFEKLCAYDEIQRCFTESRFGPSHIYPKRVMLLLEITTGVNENPKHDPIVEMILTLSSSPDVLFSPNKPETIASINALYELYDKNFSKTPARLKAEGIDPETQAKKVVNNNILLKTMLPGLSGLNIIAFRNKIDAESTPLIIALIRYKQDTGNYPESLDKLTVQGYIKQVPVDPFSDKPITYRKTDNSFILYSWGSNLKDDDGRIAHDEKGKPKRFADEGDWVFWPVSDSQK